MQTISISNGVKELGLEAGRSLVEIGDSAELKHSHERLYDIPKPEVVLWTLATAVGFISAISFYILWLRASG